MKKIGAFLMVVVLSAGLVTGYSETVYAAEKETCGITVRELTEEEYSQLAGVRVEIIACEQQVVAPSLDTTATYTAEEIPYRYGYYYEGDLLAITTETCTVWRYTDGKVHLYSRNISAVLYNSDFYANLSYGSIVNTDGSLCYTSGDTISFWKTSVMSTFALDFTITPSSYSFNYYEVTD